MVRIMSRGAKKSTQDLADMKTRVGPVSKFRSLLDLADGWSSRDALQENLARRGDDVVQGKDLLKIGRNIYCGQIGLGRYELDLGHGLLSFPVIMKD